MPGEAEFQAPAFDQSETRVFIDLALERGYVTSDQIEECQGIRGKLRDMGLEEKISDILVKKGYLSESNANRVSKAISGRRRLGNYEIIARIGQGSMGSVFKARQVSMDRNVALKILPPRLAKDQLYVARFLREARAVAKLNHVNIVQGIDVGEEQGYYYFAMEYVEGVTVRETLKNKGPYREKEALEIVIQIARALDHAAKAGLVHRDVKPDNVIVTPQGVAKLLDLGIAKTADQSVDEGLRLGTPYYISPEQARGDASVDVRSDIYSLGASFYHMMVGSPPFSGSSAEEVVRAHLTATVPNPREVRPGLSRNISRVIEMMMAREAADRYQTPEELLADLDKVARGLPPAKARTFRASSSVATGPETAPTGLTSPVGMVGRRRFTPLVLAAAAAGLLVLMLLTVVVIFLLRQDVTPPPPQPPPDKPPDVVQQPDPPPEQPPDPPPTDGRERTAESMLQFALDEIAQKPDDLDSAIAMLTTVVRDTPGTAANLKASKKLKELQAELDRRLGEQLEAAAARAGERAGENRYAEALAELDKAAPAFRRYGRWRDALEKRRGDMLKRGSDWVAIQEQLAAAHTAKFEFEQARKVLAGMTVAGLPGTNERRDKALAAVNKAEADRKALLVQQAERREQERLAQRQVQYQGFLHELYPKHSQAGFKAAGEFCDRAAADKRFSMIADLIRTEQEDLELMKSAAGELEILLGGVQRQITITHGGQQFSGRIRVEGDRLMFVERSGHISFPLDVQKVPCQELIALTGYGQDKGKALSAGLYLTWRGDFAAARALIEKAEGAVAERGLQRLDLLVKDVQEFRAEALIRKARAAAGLPDPAGFAAALAELRAGFAGSKAFAAARADLERLELDLLLAGLDLNALTLGGAAVQGGGMEFSYDFPPGSSQALDWQSSGDMWRWGQPIFDRSGIDTFVDDRGRLVIAAPGDGFRAAYWTVPLSGFSGVEFEVTPVAGVNIGLGLGKPDVFGRGGDFLRVGINSDGRAALRQGETGVSSAGGLPIQPGRTVRMRLEFAGGRVRFLLDGREAVADNLRFDPRGSRLALMVTRGTQAAFDNVRVVCQAEPAWLRRRAELAAKLRQAGLKPGLAAEYFSDPALQRSVAKGAVPALWMWWGEGPPAPGVPRDNFGARFSGQLYVEKAGRYTLHLRADDAGHLSLGGKKIIDTAAEFRGRAEVSLTAGFHDIVVTTDDRGGGGAGIELSWEAEGLPRQVIPYELLGHK